MLKITSLQVDFDPIHLTSDRDGSLLMNDTQSSKSQAVRAAALLRTMQTRDEWLTFRVSERCVTFYIPGDENPADAASRSNKVGDPISVTIRPDTIFPSLASLFHPFATAETRPWWIA
jgi:hypothetical protein